MRLYSFESMNSTKYKNVLEDSRGAVISLKPNFQKSVLLM